MEDNFVLFWGGPFSNWYPSEFIHGGVDYNCGEQFMMQKKALYFGDTETANLIMQETSPREQKALGRKVKNFDAAAWDTVCQDIVYEGLLEKFSQNPELKDVLLDTGDRIIVEASPYDTIWGIGLGEHDPRALDQSQWRGKNYLGNVIMRVRDELKK
jgi:ribA/ribD-fused uncharacterized protein